MVQCPGFFKDYYYTLMSRLLTFPMHTVAAINGHYYAGGFCLAQCADWRVLKEERAWGCMNEVDFGTCCSEQATTTNLTLGRGSVADWDGGSPQAATRPARAFESDALRPSLRLGGGPGRRASSWPSDVGSRGDRASWMSSSRVTARR